MLCLFALSMVLSAWALPPDEKKVTLDLKDVPMETFLNTVKQKAGINMLYNSQMFKGVEPVTVKAANESWKELLDRVLSPKGFTYATKDGIVVIKKKDQKTRTLEGKVVDEQGGELPGVTVLILGKERNIKSIIQQTGQRRYLATVHIYRIAQRLKSEKRDAHRKENIHCRERASRQRGKSFAQKIGVLEVTQQSQIDEQTQHNPCLT